MRSRPLPVLLRFYILKLDLARSLSFGYAKRDAEMLVGTDSEWKSSIRTIDCG
jgi:hypothetical protein